MKNNNYDNLNEFRQNYSFEIVRQIDQIETLVLELERESNENLINQLNRKLMAEFHSIKGNAAALNFESVKIICHKVEDLMIYENETPQKNRIEIILKYLDTIKDYFATFNSQGTINEQDFFKKHNDIFFNVEIVHQKKKIGNTQNKELINILFIDISLTIVKNIKRMLPELDFHISTATNSLNAIERISREKFDVIISSYSLEPINGLNLCLAIKSQWPNLKSLYILLHSQTVQLNHANIPNVFYPDCIIEKNEKLHIEIVSFLKRHVLKYRKVSKIICFDDQENILELYKLIFSDYTHLQIKYISSESEYIKQLEEFRPNLVISDVHLEQFNISGILKKYSHQSSFVFITGDTDSPNSKKLSQEGAIGIWDKSVISTDLIPKLIELKFIFEPSDQ